MRIFDSIVSKTPIDEGWSGDRKYCAVTSSGVKYLLRIASAKQMERKRREYDEMCKVASLGIPMCRPAEFGECEDGVYSLITWIDGVDAESHILTMTPAQQYRYGLDAGRILAKIHTIPAPENIPQWDVRFNAKIDRKIAMYNACGMNYECDAQAFIRFIAENRFLLSSRPQTFQHGDYHIGNMMFDTAGEIVVIDFDRFDYGDPWEEFNRIVWSAQAAPAFASGIVDGYFDGEVPDDFWRLLALYICSNTLSSLPWAIDYGEKEIAVMQHQASEIYAWYDGMKKWIPAWYTPSPRGKKGCI